MVRDLAALAEVGDPAFRPLYIHMGTPEQGEEFFARFDPEARAVSDPDKELYRAFGLERGTVWSLMGPSVWWSGTKAMLKGNGMGLPVGDPMMMPGVFLIHAGRVVWRQVSETSGEALRFDELQAEAAGLPTD